MSDQVTKATDIISFWKGVVRGETIFLLAGSDQLSEEQIPHTMIMEFQEKARALVSLDWTARDIVPDPDFSDAVLVMGLNGEVVRFRGGEVEELPPIGSSSSELKGTLLNLRQAGGELFACGGNQQVYFRDFDNRWASFNDGITRPKDEGLSQFEFIVGDRRKGGLYTGGARGEAWHYNGRHWTELDIPTNVRLIAAVMGPDGNWWIAGQLGILMRGSGDEWDVLHIDDGIPYFWDLAFLGDRLFLTTDRVLFEWKEGELEAVNFADESLYEGAIPFSFYKLFVADRRLYSFGAKDVLCLEDDFWKRII